MSTLNIKIVMKKSLSDKKQDYLQSESKEAQKKIDNQKKYDSVILKL